MPRTLLVGTHKFTWREWLKRSLRGRDLLLLDCSDPSYGPMARASLVRNGKVAEQRFIGSLDAVKNPIWMMQAAMELGGLCADGAVIQLFNYRPQPVASQLAVAIAQLLSPTEILVPAGAGLPLNVWPVGPVEVELEEAFPEMVAAAQRRARWIEMIENSYEHQIDLASTTVSGTRFGSGERLSTTQLAAAGIEGILWAEKCGGTTLLVTKRALEEHEINRVLNVTHSARVQITDPLSYSGHLCSLARSDGSDIGIGMIEEVDFVHGIARILAVAVPPIPVRILKIGTQRIDATGREIGDDKPWTI